MSAAIAVLLALLQSEGGHTKDTLDDVKAAVAKKAAAIVDVREKKEWDAGHLEGAIFLPLSGLRVEPVDEKALAEKLPKKTILYLHCRSGARVLPAAEILRKAGYDVRPLKPGFEDLLKAGFPRASAEK